MKGNKGFTLIEVVISMAILAIIVTIIYETFAASFDTVERVEKDMDTYHMIRLSLSKLSNEISSAYYSNKDKNTGFVGINNRIDDRPSDTIKFTSLSHYRYKKYVPESDISLITYYMNFQPEDKGSLLMHQEQGNIYAIEGGMEEYELAENISGFDLQYYDGEKWQEEWDSEELKRLPKAVSIRLSIKDQNNRDKVFSIIAEIPR
ncbi:MAG: type II secretion system protein GspJ [Nitrospirota bacterium]